VHAIPAGLVDEYELLVVPTMLGGGKRILPGNVNAKLNLLEERRFKNGIPSLSHAKLRVAIKAMDNTRVFRMAFASVYPHYTAKAEKKGRSKEEVHAIIHWLTGYDEQALQQQIDKKVSFETFFSRAPRINPNASKITGVICGYRVEEIEDNLMQQIRYLDKLVDELAKGKAMDKILRK
jgi:hypothetical protein